MSFDGRLATLKISNFSETRAGTYECVAKSDFGEVRTSTQVTYEKSCKRAIGVGANRTIAVFFFSRSACR